MEESVKAAIEEIRPNLQMDGGDIEFVEMDGNKVKVRLLGACHGCPSATYTMAFGVEKHIKKRVPEVEAVIAV
jgi:Fe-S cluster biogenesis protein NfuA